ncbi:MAG TPA: serine hydrolase domain-containing protein [Candidatus Paceibacterota bacterium]
MRRIHELLVNAVSGENPLFGKGIFAFQNIDGKRAYFPIDVSGKGNECQVSDFSQFDIASITKFFLTILYHILRERFGKFDNNTLVAPVLGMSGAFTEHLTVGHLLQFCAQFTAKGYPTKDIVARSKNGVVNGLTETLTSCGLEKMPGESWTYGNPHSILLGFFLERAMGESLESLMQKHLLDPLDMHRTTVRPVPDGSVIQSGKETSGGTIHDPTARAALSEGRVIGSAGYFSTASDLLNLLGMIHQGGMHGENRIISGETARTLHAGMLPIFGNGAGKWNVYRKGLVPEAFMDDLAIFKLGHTGCIVFVSKRHGICGTVLTDYLMYHSESEKRTPLYGLFAQLGTAAGLCLL